MFRKDLIIRGKHASFLDKLSRPFNEDARLSFFERNVDVILTAPVIGLTYNRFAKTDNSGDNTAKVMTETLLKEQQHFNFVFRLTMLLHDRQKTSLESRINKAFRMNSQSSEFSEAIKIFEGYILGGIEYLYEKLIEPSKTYDQYLSNLYEFVLTHNNRYFAADTDDQIEELCRLASDF